MVSETVFFSPFSPFFLFFSFDCFYVSKKPNANLWQPTVQKMYPHMTPTEPEFFFIEGNLISNMYTARSWSFAVYFIFYLKSDDLSNMKCWMVGSS